MRVLVAGHELFGHGSGKLIYRGEDGKCPLSLIDPVDGSVFSSCYEKGENFATKFGEFSSSYEECRADLMGLYLQKFPEMYKVFGYKQDEIIDLQWTNLIGILFEGVVGMPDVYSFESKKWKQAHA